MANFNFTTGRYEGRPRGRSLWTPAQKVQEAFQQGSYRQVYHPTARYLNHADPAEVAALRAKFEAKVADTNLPEDVEYWLDDEAVAWARRQEAAAKEARRPVNQMLARVQVEIDSWHADHPGRKCPVYQVRDWAEQLDFDGYHPALDALFAKNGLEVVGRG